MNAKRVKQTPQVWLLCGLTFAIIALTSAPELAHAQCPSDKKADVLFLMDISGSISTIPWSPKNGFCNAFNAYDSRLRFGLMAFNLNPTLHENIGENNASKLCTHFGTIKPQGPVDYHKAFLEVENTWKKVIAADTVKNRPRYIVLFSDKEHNGADPNPIIKRMFNPGISVGGANVSIKTFAAGRGSVGKLPKLDQYAISGGTQKAYYYTDGRDATPTLSAIFAQTVQQGCLPLETTQEASPDADAGSPELVKAQERPDAGEERSEETPDAPPPDPAKNEPTATETPDDGSTPEPVAEASPEPTPEPIAETTTEQSGLGEGGPTVKPTGCGCQGMPAPSFGLALLLLLVLCSSTRSRVGVLEE